MKTLIALAAGLVGCAEPNYVYTPEATNATSGGLPAARIDIPQERPQGSVQVASYGITRLGREDGDVRALHVRMTIANDGDDMPWQVDTRMQLAELPGEGQSRAMFVNTDVHTLPIVTIARHERRVIDLYYPLPATVSGNGGLPRFEMQWQVMTPERTVASSTPFERVTEDRTYYAYGYEGAWPYWAGYGPYWWYDPFYPQLVFVHAPAFRIHEGGPVRVGHFGGGFHAVGPHISSGGMHHR